MNLVIMWSPCHEFGYYVVTLLYSGGKQKALSAMVSWLHTGTPALATSDWLTRAASTETRVQAVISVLGLHQCFRWGHRKHYLTALQLIHIPFLIDLKVL